MKQNYLKLFLSIFLCLAAGFIGSVSTASSISGWYSTIIKPPFNPPNWIFGPVWTTLYILMGISLYIVWVNKAKKQEKKQAITLFSIQLALNTLWSFLFFSFQAPLYAFIEIIILLAFIILTTLSFYKISKPAAYLMVPYILWVTFASILNFSLWILNI